MGCGYYKWGSCDIIRYSDIDAASVCIGSLSASFVVPFSPVVQYLDLLKKVSTLTRLNTQSSRKIDLT